jgi:hypothetical protein
VFAKAVLAVVLLLSAAAAASAREYRWEVTSSGEMDGHNGFYMEMTIDGNLNETDFLFEEFPFIRLYAFKMSDQPTFTVVPSGMFVMKATFISIGDMWDTWVNGATQATVVANEQVTTNAGTFQCFKVQMGANMIGWAAQGVGRVQFTRGEETAVLQEYYVAPGNENSYFPMTVGSWWRLTSPVVPARSSSWGSVKGLYGGGIR